MIYLLDSDLKGTTSISKYIESGAVRHLVCGTYMQYQAHTKDLLSIVTPNDLVILDTMSNMLDTARGDQRYGDDPNDDLWAKRNVDDPYGRSYDVASKFVMRRLKNLSARGARIMTICHESEVQDDTVVPARKVRGPDVNQKFVNTLVGSSSDVYRLEQLLDDMTKFNEDGTTTTIAKADDRILYLKRDPTFIAKNSCDIERSPKIMRGLLNPTLPKLYEHLGVRPPWITLFGPAGVGKTTLAVSEAAAVVPN